jgi:hypothetical protein
MGETLLQSQSASKDVSGSKELFTAPTPAFHKMSSSENDARQRADICHALEEEGKVQAKLDNDLEFQSKLRARFREFMTPQGLQDSGESGEINIGNLNLSDAKHKDWLLSVADDLDKNDAVHHLREEFLIPDKGNYKTAEGDINTNSSADAASSKPSTADTDDKESVYFVGHSLGLQPKRTRELINGESRFTLWDIAWGYSRKERGS